MLATVLETIAGRKVRISRTGSATPLILLHGYPDNLQIWSRLASHLSDSFEVIAFDWPGMGYSEQWPGGATPEHLADRLATILNAFHWEQASIVAMDMGAQPAFVFAAKYPSRLDRLVVMNCLAFGDETTSWEIRLLRKFAWNRWLLRSAPRLIFWRALKTFLPAGDSLSDEIRFDLWSAFRKEEVRKYISKMCAGYQGTLPGLPAFYANIRCPTLILWAEKDAHFPVIHAKKLNQIVPQSTLHIIENAHHWMVWHDAENIARLIKTFLAPWRLGG
ncbi:alpha/beta hydrolase [bacterium]|nr:alpha/beta hydrolase [bacterium]